MVRILKYMKKGTITTTILMWVAGGAVTLLSTVALAFSTSTSAKLGVIQEKDNGQDISIALLNQSNCINNQNLVNIGNALKVKVVTDGNCISK